MKNCTYAHDDETLKAIQVMIAAIGDDPDREGLLETPQRVVRSWQELFAGYTQDPASILSKKFANDEYEGSLFNGSPMTRNPEHYEGMVFLRGFSFTSFCEHHILPFHGHAYVAYIPRHYVVGLSKLGRLVDCFAKRLQIQERMTQQIANALESNIESKGVAVLLDASHECMSCRGVRRPNATLRTCVLTGAFRERPEARNEFMAGVNGR